MAWIIGDGFDLYGAASDLAASGVWDSGAVTSVITTGNAGRATNSKCLSLATTSQYPTLTKTSGSNDAGHHICFAWGESTAYATPGSVRGIQFGLLDGTTHQCSFVVDAVTGNIMFYSGNVTTLLGTFAAGMPFGATSWTGVEVEIVIHNTAGSIRVRLNGNTTDDYVLTNVNTRGGTTNAYANKLQIGVGPLSITGAGVPKLDDLLWFSTSGAAPNTWVGDIRCETRHPTSTASTGLTASPATANNPSALSGSATNLFSNTITSSTQVVTTTGGSLTALTMSFNTSFTGHYRLAVYDGSTGNPTTLLAQTAEQTNAAVGQVTVPLITPIAVAVGAKLFYAILSDGSVNLNVATGFGVAVAQTYASGFINLTASVSSGNRFVAMGVITVDNYANVAEVTSDSDTSFVYGATAGMNDLYSLTPMSSTPLSILGVQTRLASRKSDTGTRTARIQVKSGGTTSNGGTFTMGTSYTYANKLDVTDPNGPTAWTLSSLNSLQVGAYVVA